MGKTCKQPAIVIIFILTYFAAPSSGRADFVRSSPSNLEPLSGGSNDSRSDSMGADRAGAPTSAAADVGKADGRTCLSKEQHAALSCLLGDD